MENQYIGLTIGPIYKTLKDARKTRELWAGSYFFSYLMKSILNEFKRIDPTITERVILPYIQDKEVFEQKNGIGLFPDWFIMKSEKGDFENLILSINETINTISKNLVKDKIGNYEDNKTFLSNYLTTACVEVDVADKNPAHTVKQYLDNIELQTKTVSVEKHNPWLALLNNAPNTFLANEAFEKNSWNIKTIGEYSTVGLREKDTELYDFTETQFNSKYKKEEDEAEFLDAIKLAFNNKYKQSPQNQFKTYHKYICVVKADGDNIGKTITRLGNNLDGFSKDLFEFGKQAAQLIKNFNGLPIYIGGDDLLFFAPAVSQSGTIFNLMNELDKVFADNIGGKTEYTYTDPETQTVYTPSLSFGVSISYHKYPLYEAHENSDALLKKTKENKDQKNKIAWQVLRHSGKSWGAILNKDKKSVYTNSFIPLFDTEKIENEEQFISAISEKIKQSEQLLQLVATEANIDLRAKRLEALYDIHFDKKGEHGDALAKTKFLQHIQEITAHLMETTPKGQKFRTDDLYSIIRTVKFMKGFENDNN